MEEEYKDKFDRFDSVPDDFVDKADKSQQEILDEVEMLLAELETKDGAIVFSQRNLSIINSLDQRLKTVFTGQYADALTVYLSEFNQQARITNRYFSSIESNFVADNKLYQSVLLNAQQNALDLLGEDALTQRVINPLKQMLEASVTGSQSFNETLKSLRIAIKGNPATGKDGLLLSHVKRVAYDAFAAADRSYTNAIATDLGLQFFMYFGGTVQDTRCFCAERHGKYYHKKEIEGWGTGKGVGSCGYPWQGMNSATNSSTIFIFAGGYNCKHGILPRSEKSVPKDVIKRATEAGYYLS